MIQRVITAVVWATLVSAIVILVLKTDTVLGARSGYVVSARLTRLAAQQRIRVSESPLVKEWQRLLRRGEPACTDARKGAKEILVIVLGRNSLRSGEERPELDRFVAGGTWSPDQRVWIITDGADTGQLAASFASHVSTCSFTVIDAREFVERTGISSVPAALLFEDDELQMMISGPLGADALKTLGYYTSVGRRVQPVSPFLYDQPGDPILPPSQHKSASGI